MKKAIIRINSHQHKSLKAKKQKAKRIVKRSRPIHKKVLLHPITVFLLLCTGVFIVMWTYKALADSIDITAKVAAPALIQGAVITEPSDGASFITSPINVSGTCPLSSYVVLTRNNLMSGTALCASDNTFVIETSLSSGTNVLQAQDYNLTDDPGPTTAPIDVFYTPPAVTPIPPASSPSSPSATTPSKTSAGASLPILTGDYNYRTFDVNSDFESKLQITDGKGPYRLDIDWGDGTTSTQTEPEAKEITITHHYSKAGYYTIKVKLTDTNGSVTFLQLTAVITDSDSVSLGSTTNPPQQNSFLGASWLLLAKHWVVFAWGSYATVTLMSISFWLGERQQVSLLLNLKHLRHIPRGHHRA